MNYPLKTTIFEGTRITESLKQLYLTKGRQYDFLRFLLPVVHIPGNEYQNVEE